MAYNDGGQICYDKNGAVFVRIGNNIKKCTAMIEWDGMLVLGNAAGDASTEPNLLFLRKAAYKEQGTISAGTCSEETITSKWTSANYHAADYSLKRITRLEVTYFNDHGFVHHATNSGFTIYYRRNNETLTSGDSNYMNADGVYLPKWTSLKAVPTPAGTSNANYDHEHTVVYEMELDKEARFWQFRITSDYDFQVIGFTVWAEKEPLTAD